ncbi:MAG: homoserine kinase [Anaerolineales bacterium]|nr:homoserine kinase [Anaerolineales bacterium]MDW8226625.1 homoserine kinase [Anaerolineales bacterium]
MLKIRVPATSANLGPGFDCLGLALDLWNEISFEPADELIYAVTGENAPQLANPATNLLTRSLLQVYQRYGKRLPGLRIHAHNQIWINSGIGSSAASIVAGLFAANELLGQPMDLSGLLRVASEIEGHPDNVAPALLGGLVIAAMLPHEVIWRRYELTDLSIVIVKPEMEWTTAQGRAILPDVYSRTDAVFNIARTPLVIDALRRGDLDLLQQVMDDRLHQPYRLKHILAGEKAYWTARKFGATALSGAGPSFICFVPAHTAEIARRAILEAIYEEGVQARSLITRPSNRGVHVVKE